MTACIGCDEDTGAVWRKFCPPCWDLRRGKRAPSALVPPSPKVPPQPPRPCADCGVEIPRARARCGPCQAARKAQLRNDARRALPVDATCVECGKPFQRRGNASKVCGEKCRLTRRRRQTMESSRRVERRPYRRKLKVDPDEERGISVEEYLERVRPMWARDQAPQPDVWAGYDGSRGAADA